MVDAVLKALPKGWNGVVGMDWSNALTTLAFYQRSSWLPIPEGLPPSPFCSLAAQCYHKGDPPRSPFLKPCLLLKLAGRSPIPRPARVISLPVERIPASPAIILEEEV